ncbi:MAG: DUF2934 domain-containing protein [Bacillota bacterium]
MRTQRGTDTGKGAPTPEARERMIAQLAYFRAEKRGFAPGGELQDWLEAETEVDALLSAGETAQLLAVERMITPVAG